MKKKILLTGSQGFIGRNLYSFLKEKYDVFCVDHYAFPDNGISRYFKVDLLSQESVDNFSRVVSDIKFYSVIHTAFLLCRPDDRQSLDYLHKNTQITENMVKLLKKINFGSLLNFSSIAVYTVKNAIFKEESEINMSKNTECLYGIAKFNSEMLFTFLLSDKAKIVNLRLCQVYGPGMQDDRLVGSFMKELADQNKITVYGNGKRVSNFLHVKDLCVAVSAVLANPSSGTYNLGCFKNMSYLDLAQKIIDEKGFPGSRIVKISKGSTAKAKIATKKFVKTFGYKCTTIDFGF